MAKKPVPDDVWSRSRAVLQLTAGVVGQELKHRVRATLASAEAAAASELRARVLQATMLTESLGRLKGAFMKAGQLLSIDAGELLPPEALEILGKLQGQAEPVDFQVLADVVTAELGERGAALLASLDRAPAAAASIGQVHRGTLDGQDLAVKIQYPGIAESIDADIALLEKLGGSWLSLTGRRIDLSGAFEELRTILHLEADYERERAYLERYHALLSADGRFRVPRSLPALSSRRVLTMSFVEGTPLRAWLRAAPPFAAREALARTALDLYCLEFLDWGMVQTDPNFGNYLLAADGALVLLDFGATVEYDAAFRADYLAMLRTVGTGDRARILERGVAFGLLDAREPEETRALFVDMMLEAAEPFDPRRQPFDFRDADYAQRSQATLQRFVRSLRFSPPPRRLLFLHRRLGGIFQLLKQLDLRLDLTPYWARMMDTLG